MLCRDCDTLVQANENAKGEATPERAGHAESTEPTPATGPLAEQLCTRCGHLLGTDVTVKRVRQKKSQLERFGLSGPHRPLTKPRRGESD